MIDVGYYFSVHYVKRSGAVLDNGMYVCLMLVIISVSTM